VRGTADMGFLFSFSMCFLIREKKIGNGREKKNPEKEKKVYGITNRIYIYRSYF